MAEKELSLFVNEMMSHKVYSFIFERTEMNDLTEEEGKATYVLYFSSKEDAEKAYSILEKTEQIFTEIMVEEFVVKDGDEFDSVDPWSLINVSEGYNAHGEFESILSTNPFEEQIGVLGLIQVENQFNEEHQFLIHRTTEY